MFDSVSLNQGLTSPPSRHHRRLESVSPAGQTPVVFGILFGILFGGSYYRSSSLGYPESPSGLSLTAFVKHIYENHRPPV